jgi:hypothetical protein
MIHPFMAGDPCDDDGFRIAREAGRERPYELYPSYNGGKISALTQFTSFNIANSLI